MADGLVAGWAAARAAALVLGAPALLAWMGVRSARSTASVHASLDAYASAVADVLAGRPAPPPLASVARVDAGDRWVVTSDLHRGPAGPRDWPTRQGVVPVYLAMLGHYADRGWGLIENGDVEDTWMVGGTRAGVGYDAARLAAGALRRRRVADAVVRAHLRRTFEAHAPTYRAIQEGFHRHGRYRRVVGNHDDVLARPEVRRVLEQVHPGLDVHDAVLLAPGDVGGVGPRVLVTHGHHTDPWNAPGHARLGRVGTWCASVLSDLPRGAELGLPPTDATERLRTQGGPNLATRTHRVFGATRDQYSMDEVRLHGALRRRPEAWPDGLVLGHTHLPFDEPVLPDGTRWHGYANSGCGVLPGGCTAVEWDGTAEQPELRLVLWDLDGTGAARRTVLTADGVGARVVPAELATP